jgi:hypothetical protein
MLTAKFLKSLTARQHEEYRSKLFNRHAAARAIAMTPAEPVSNAGLGGGAAMVKTARSKLAKKSDEVDTS